MARSGESPLWIQSNTPQAVAVLVHDALAERVPSLTPRAAGIDDGDRGG
jgi:hypothetical protein